tara:strand:- start:1028 stop:2149 length:1122 start_codon:yes stop_codon:yes gene_type:complete
MDNNKIGFKVLNFDAIRDKPVFKAARNGDYIEYGSDNGYPQYLLDIFHNKSNKHKAIISKKVDMATGGGFLEAKSTELAKFLVNSYGKKDLGYVATRINYDFEIHNGFAMLVRWNNEGNKIAAIDWLPFHKCRLSIDEQNILVSKDWLEPRKAINKPVTYPIFSPELAKDNPTQVFYYIEESNGIDYYTLPYYSSTLSWIELDYEIATFHLASVRNNFNAGFILNFATGVPTEEEMANAQREMERKFTGTKNAGKFIITFSEGQDSKPELIPLEMNSSDERFILLHREMLTEIFIGHSVTSPLLFGIRTEGQLGGRSELLEALAIFQSTYISSKQTILEKAFNKLAVFAGVTEKMELKQYSIDFSAVESKVTV